ncbi:MAG: hypothetical protein M3R13_01200 [Armatimonadota bacterium]|nr:hypothetical protein [Armatimonadota bacterium]
MFKKLCLLSVVCLAAVAAADHILAVGSNGHGTVTAQDGRVGAFHYAVVKRTAEGHHPRFEGSLRFEQRDNEAGDWAVVRMGTPRAVRVDRNMCEFMGPGAMTTVVKGQNVTVHGRVSGVVVDRRNPRHPHGEPDIFRIRFEDEHHNVFMFNGIVHDGDLVVFTRVLH